MQWRDSKTGDVRETFGALVTRSTSSSIENKLKTAARWEAMRLRESYNSRVYSTSKGGSKYKHHKIPSMQNTTDSSADPYTVYTVYGSALTDFFPADPASYSISHLSCDRRRRRWAICFTTFHLTTAETVCISAKEIQHVTSGPARRAGRQVCLGYF